MGALKRLACAAVIVCLCAVAVQGQTMAGGSITANGQAVTAGWGNAQVNGASIQITGTWTGTITFQATVDGTNYVTLLASNVTSGATASSTTANGAWGVSNSGYKAIRATATAAMTGTAVVTINQGYATGGGGGASGSVTQGTDPWLVGGTGATYLGKAEDVAHTTADTGVAMLAVVSATTPTATSATAGDYAVPNLDANGRMYVNATLYNAAGAAVSVATDVTEDAPETAGGTGPMVLNVRRDAPASSAGTTGDNATFNTSALGALYTATVDPCSYKAKSYYVLNASTAATVEIANAVASEYWYICGVNLVAAAAQTIAIATDDTDGCGSLTAGLHGGVTAATGWSFAANGGIALGNGNATVMKAATANHYLCFITGQAAQISGTIIYVTAP